MKTFRKPIIIASIYILVTAILFVFDLYYLKPSVISYVAEQKRELSHRFDIVRMILQLIVIPLICLAGTIHTLVVLPISTQIKKRIIIASLVVGGIIAPFLMYLSYMNSKDGCRDLIWIAILIFPCAVSILIIIVSVLIIFLKRLYYSIMR